MYIVAVEFTIKEQFVNQFRKRIQKQSEDSLAHESECHHFDVCFDSNDETKCFLYEKYTDEAAFEYHRTTEYFQDFATQIGPWVVSKDLKIWVCD